MAGDPMCIRRAGSVEEAEIIVAWLEERDVEATVIDPSNPGVMAFGVTDPEGVEIWVANAEVADRARGLLTEHDKQHTADTAAASDADPVDVTCSECGEVVSFPAHLRGTVQECSECGTHLDVPSDDE